MQRMQKFPGIVVVDEERKTQGTTVVAHSESRSFAGAQDDRTLLREDDGEREQGQEKRAKLRKGQSQKRQTREKVNSRKGKLEGKQTYARRLGVGGIEDVEGVEPGIDELGPGGDGELGAAETVAVAAFGVDVEFGGNFGVFESEEVDGGVFDVDGIVFGLKDEGRRSVGGDGKIGIEGEVVVFEGEIAGIDDDGEIGAAALGIRGVYGIVEAFVEMGAESGGEVGSSGKAEDADAVGIEVPIGGAGANDAHGALGVLQSGGGFGIGAGIGDAIFDEDAGDADGGEPVADFGAFKIDGEDVIAAAGKDEDGGAGIITFGRIDGEGGLGDVAEADEGFAGDEIVFRGGGVNFGSGIGGAAPGAALGQRGMVVRLAGGAQAGFCARADAAKKRNATDKVERIRIKGPLKI